MNSARTHLLKDLKAMVALLKFAAPQMLKSFDVVLLSVIPKWNSLLGGEM
jgi:hypothetical protein